jgi:hypothetical protein
MKRLLGIVLAKFLLFGDHINQDLYNFRTQQLNIFGCDIPSYTNLVHGCFQPNISTPFVAAFVRSICVFEFGKLPSENSKKAIEDPSTILQNLKSINATAQIATLRQLFLYQLTDIRIIESLVSCSFNNETSTESVAVLSTISPQILNSMMSLDMKERKHVEVIDAKDLEHIRSILRGTVIADVFDAMAKLNSMDKSKESVYRMLLFCLRDHRWQVRQRAVVYLKSILHREDVLMIVLSHLSHEKTPEVKAEIATTLGESSSPIAISALHNLAGNSNDMIARRAIVSLAKSAKLPIEEKNALALRLCTISEKDSIEEKQLVAVGLRNLKIVEPVIIEKLLGLLEDEDGAVRLEAGRSLGVLKGL